MKLGYLLKETWRTITRNFSQFFLASAVMAICLLLTALFLVITLNVLKISASARAWAEIYAFVTDDIANDPAPLLKRVIDITGVAAVRFVSKAEAFDELRAELGSDTLLLDVLGENPLPASIRIALHPNYTDVENVSAIEQKLLLLPGVTEVWSGKELLAQLNRALKILLIIDIGIFIIVAASVIFIAFQTVESSVITRAQEVEIMELVGASRMAIRIPFILQGLLQGTFGSITAFLLIFIIFKVVTSFIPTPFFPSGVVLGTTLLSGLLFGLGGSILALNRLPSTLIAKPKPQRLRSL